MFGVEVTDISRRLLVERYRLLPYLYSLLAEAAETGAPPLRPLVYEFQADPTTPEGQAYLAEAQALFGPGVVPEAPPEEPVPLALDPGTAIALVVAAIGGIIGVLAFTGLPRRRAG